MKRFKNGFHLYYSIIGSIPVLGYIFYVIQVTLIRCNITHILYLSKKDKQFLPILLSIVEKKHTHIICHTFKVGHPLCHFSRPIFVTIKDSQTQKIDINREKNYQSLLWTLVKTEAMDKTTHKLVKKWWNLDFKNVIPQI